MWHKQMFVYIDGEFAINGIQPKFRSLLFTGKFRRGVTERERLKRIFTSGEIPLCSGCAYHNPAVCNLKPIKYRIEFERDHL